ncbi:hypothetical protein LLG88_12330 [bacterium]|nr:hypothetical protein [bacterium]
MDIKRNMTTPESRRFWAGVERGAARYAALPQEQQGVLGVLGRPVSDQTPQRAERMASPGLKLRRESSTAR